MYTSNYSQHFVPKGTAAIGEETVSATAAGHGGYLCVQPCRVRRLIFVITEAIAADDTAPVVEFNKRPTPGSATGEELVGQLTLPDTTAIGKVVYKDIDPVDFETGDELALEHVTQAVDGSSAAGKGFYAFEIESRNEYEANLSELVLSA